MTIRMTLLLAGICVFCAALVPASDWPQWRGPQRDAISKETGLLKVWPKEGPKLLWQMKDIGDGYSTPAVVGKRLYLMSNKGQDNEFVQARDVDTGKEIWTTKAGKVGPNLFPSYPGSRSTPSVDGDMLYALSSDGDFLCLKTSDGSRVWHKNLRKDFAGVPGRWVYSESPLVDGDVVVCTPGGKEATIVALDKKTGNVVWKCPIPTSEDTTKEGEKAAYASVIIVNFGGIKQYVQFLANGVVGVDAKSGKFLWRYDRTATGSPANIPTPVAQDGFVYTGTGKAGGGLIKLKVDKGVVSAQEVYFKKNLPTSIGGSVLLGEYLYGTNNQGLLCIEFATGAEKWQNKSIGAASLCFADGRLYLHGENGDVALVEPTPDGYREKGRFTPPDPPKRGTSKAWAYPVVANGRMFLRDLGMLWCYDVRDPNAARKPN